jgi:hypothetical protein
VALAWRDDEQVHEQVRKGVWEYRPFNDALTTQKLFYVELNVRINMNTERRGRPRIVQ